MGNLNTAFLNYLLWIKNGNIVKHLTKKLLLSLMMVKHLQSYLPEFYNGYAVIHFVDDSDLNKNSLNMRTYILQMFMSIKMVERLKIYLMMLKRC